MSTRPEIATRSAALSASSPPIPWPIATVVGPEPVERRDDVLDVRVEREGRRVGRQRPVVVAQVDRVAFPAAPREVAEEPLPDPRAGELAVDEQQRLAPRPSLRAATTRCRSRDRAARSRPCGPAGRSTAAPGRGPGSARGSCRTSGSPLVRVDDEARQGLGIEVGRFLGHHVALAGDGLDGRTRASARAGTRHRRRPGVDRGDRVGRRLGVFDRAAPPRRRRRCRRGGRARRRAA